MQYCPPNTILPDLSYRPVCQFGLSCLLRICWMLSSFMDLTASDIEVISGGLFSRSITDSDRLLMEGQLVTDGMFSAVVFFTSRCLRINNPRFINVMPLLWWLLELALLSSTDTSFSCSNFATFMAACSCRSFTRWFAPRIAFAPRIKFLRESVSPQRMPLVMSKFRLMHSTMKIVYMCFYLWVL